MRYLVIVALGRARAWRFNGARPLLWVGFGHLTLSILADGYLERPYAFISGIVPYPTMNCLRAPSFRTSKPICWPLVFGGGFLRFRGSSHLLTV